ncbi:MAG: DUF4350 domain-containing protein [Gemmatimonadales bacterium]|nr:DUF4350 domain-containing protein [Gemmatimonadales bacterium]
MSYRLEIGLALLLGVAIGVAVWAGNRSEKPPAIDSRNSTLLSGPGGSKGLYEVLVRFGQPVERLRTPLTSLASDSAALRRRAPPALLVVLDPPLRLDFEEIEAVVRFVHRGGAVLAAGSGGGITRCAGWRLEPESYLDDSLDVRQPVAGETLNLPRAGRVLAPRRRRIEKPGAALDRLVKRQPGEADPCAVLEASGRGQRRDTLLAAVNGRPVVMRLQYARGGSITLAADAGWFTNRVWRDTDVPRVAVGWLTPPTSARGRVAWDEFHQGFGRQGGPSLTGVTWDWLRHTPLGWAILQLVAVALVWLGVTAVRFGPARAVVERRRRSPLEHLEALAAGLESAAADDTAVRRIVAGLRRRLSRADGAGYQSGDLEAWLESLELAMRGPRGRDAARRLRRLIHAGGVLAAAQAVEDVWEELRPRTTPAAF